MREVFPLVLLTICVCITGYFITKNYEDLHELDKRAALLEVRVNYLLNRMQYED